MLSIETKPGRAWHGAATFLAVLAYPESARKRDEFIGACEQALSHVARRVRRNPASGPALSVVGEGPAPSMRPRDVARSFDMAGRRIVKHRLPAAEMAVSRLIGRDAGAGPTERPSWAARDATLLGGVVVPELRISFPAPGSRRLAAAHAAKVNRADEIVSGGETTAHVLTRTWKATQPVLHLALAFHVAYVESRADALSLDEWIYDPAWLPRALDRAETFRALLWGRRAPFGTVRVRAR